MLLLSVAVVVVGCTRGPAVDTDFDNFLEVAAVVVAAAEFVDTGTHRHYPPSDCNSVYVRRNNNHCMVYQGKKHHHGIFYNCNMDFPSKAVAF